jgi:hypothetical protein
MRESLNDLAGFPMRRSNDENGEGPPKLEICAAVDAYQAGYESAQMQQLMRAPSDSFGTRTTGRNGRLGSTKTPTGGKAETGRDNR